jgi:L-ascorbate metabolism protein UlaG (beta-lactamase superfamily)
MMLPGPRDDTAPSLSWLGHATVDVIWAGTRIVTDPVLRHRVAHLRRHRGVAELEPGPVDLVVVSHLHHDHLDLPSLRRLPAGTTIAVPAGSGRWMEKNLASRRLDVIEMPIEHQVRVGNLRITAVDATHQRGRFARRVRGGPYGVLIERDDRVVYFPGDTDLHPFMADFPVCDVALLPIWGWGSTLGAGHLDPDRAAQAAQLVRARHVLPIHWGTFAPVGVLRRAPHWLDRPRTEFAQALERHAPDSAMVDMLPGPTPWRPTGW